MKNLYVGNLPHSTTEAELRSVFEAHGAVEKVSMVTDRDTGRSRGFAFVEMTDAGEAEKAIAALNGTDLGGRTLKINEAKPKTERPGGFGGGAGKRFAGGVGGGRGGFGGGGGGGRGGSGGGGGRGGRGRDDGGHARGPREPRW
jgi:RNA recognition motif-containing protein